MKNPLEIIKVVPKEAIAFFFAVLGGSFYKMHKQNQRGIAITLKRMIVETFASFFIAAIVYGVMDQFLHFNLFFTCVMCSLAGSMDSLIHSKFEALVDVAFEAAQNKIKR